VSNPPTGVEQLTYLLFIRRFNEIRSREECKAQAVNPAKVRKMFLDGADGLVMPGCRTDLDTGEGEDGCPYALIRWSRFKNGKAGRMSRSLTSTSSVHSHAHALGRSDLVAH
jgi:type I restriction enzyme M protein